jgi:hypothetical protein
MRLASAASHAVAISRRLNSSLELIFFALALAEPVKKDRAIPDAVGDKNAIAAGAPLPRPGHPLLDYPATKVGIDQSTFCSRNCFRQATIENSLRLRKPGEPSSFEYPELSDIIAL